MSESASPSPAARRYPQAQDSKTPLIIILLLILVIMVPIELGFNIGPLFFTWSRFFLVIMAFVILPKLWTLELRLHDWFFIGHVAWTCIAFAHVYGLGNSIERSGTYVLEFLIVYLTARIYLQHLEQMRAVFGTLFIMVIVSAIAAFPEAMTGIRYVHDFATSLTGTTYKYNSEIRMGITRATSFFEHPILYGVFCSSLFSLMWFTSSVSQRIFKTPIIALATWLSASSAPILILLLQAFLVLVERVTRTVQNRLLIVTGIAFTLVTIAQAATGRGFAGILAMVTLNPGTTYVRRMQWNFAIQDVLRHPLLGFEPSTWTRPFWLAPSIDNYWLLMMMRSGIPSLILLALCVFFIWRNMVRRQNMPQLYDQIRIGWGLMMVALIIGAATVAFFGKLQPLMAFYLGLGSALVSCRVPEAKDASAPAEAPPGGIRYSRFAHNRKPPAPAARPNPYARSGDK
ncbi:O-antigen ligase family protein [Neotabrizicola sp. sgz301269]|uniref:O-antigen ligase family protein n=1 Tax=Neotabrizicola sp. sgz301269 TaxID=3276282 RepID=UPI0037703DDC